MGTTAAGSDPGPRRVLPERAAPVAGAFIGRAPVALPVAVAPTRESILRVLRDALEPEPRVLAFYEGGAIAWGRLDAWSDVDLYVVVEDDALDDTFRRIDEALAGLARVERKFAVPHPPASGLAQAFYRLEGAGPHLLVDLAVLKRSAPEKYLEPELHGKNVVYFDKAGVTRVPPLDRAAFDAKMRERLARLRGRFAIFAPFVEKEMNRRNWLEALDAYRAIVLSSLVEVLRMRHAPLHHGFGMHYVHYELPPEAAERLVRLAYVRDPEDLAAKYREASAWFHETAGSLAGAAEG